MMEEAMKTRLAVLVPAVLVLCHCNNCPDLGSAQARLENLVSQLAYALATHYVGPFAGPPPPEAGSSDDPRCNGSTTAGPELEPAALTSTEGACDGNPGNDPCVACVSASCCMETVACLSESTCTCLLARRTPGISWPESVKCSAPDEAYAAALACLTAHCEQECLAQ
jgi:hypothetical protein